MQRIFVGLVSAAIVALTLVPFASAARHHHLMV
jgi:hypothetical protein